MPLIRDQAVCYIVTDCQIVFTPIARIRAGIRADTTARIPGEMAARASSLNLAPTWPETIELGVFEEAARTIDFNL